MQYNDIYKIPLTGAYGQPTEMPTFLTTGNTTYPINVYLEISPLMNIYIKLQIISI
jgi:hypothetical protein